MSMVLKLFYVVAVNNKISLRNLQLKCRHHTTGYGKCIWKLQNHLSRYVCLKTLGALELNDINDIGLLHCIV